MATESTKDTKMGLNVASMVCWRASEVEAFQASMDLASCSGGGATLAPGYCSLSPSGNEFRDRRAMSFESFGQ